MFTAMRTCWQILPEHLSRQLQLSNAPLLKSYSATTLIHSKPPEAAGRAALCGPDVVYHCILFCKQWWTYLPSQILLRWPA